MNLLLRIFGPPHEALHLLALLLIGRRPVRFTLRHVDIPDDLSRWQYVFVAAFPALVFTLVMAIGAVSLVRAQTMPDAALSLVVALIGVLGVSGTMGDIQLIEARLMTKGHPPQPGNRGDGR